MAEPAVLQLAEVFGRTVSNERVSLSGDAKCCWRVICAPCGTQGGTLALLAGRHQAGRGTAESSVTAAWIWHNSSQGMTTRS